MSDAFGDFIGGLVDAAEQAASGDVAGAAQTAARTVSDAATAAGQAVGAVAEDVGHAAERTVNAAGRVAEGITGGAVKFGVDHGNFHATTDIKTAVGEARTDVKVDLDTSDGDIGASSSSRSTFLGQEVLAGEVGASADVDGSDGTVSVETEVEQRLGGSGFESQVHVGNDKVESQIDVGTRTGGAFVRSTLDGDGANTDAGLQGTTVDDAGRVLRSEVGVTGGIDIDEHQTGVDAGLFSQTQDTGGRDGGSTASRQATERDEAVLTANVDRGDDQTGIDVGVAVEHDRDGTTVTRDEAGVTANVDTGNGQVGVDGGLFAERDVAGEAEQRIEAGATANLDGTPGGGSVDLGVFAEGGTARVEAGSTVGSSRDGNGRDFTSGVFAEVSADGKEHRAEAGGRLAASEVDGNVDVDLGVQARLDEARVGTGVNFGVDAETGDGQVGVDLGVFGEAAQGDDRSRGEVGVTANADVSPGQAGLDIGLFGEASSPEHSDRAEAVITANGDIDPGQVGVEEGLAVEVIHDGEEAFRGEAAVGVNLDTTEGQAGVDVAGSAEATGLGRVEAGLGFVEAEFSDQNVGIEEGVFVEVSTPDREVARGEANLSAQLEQDENGASLDVGANVDVTVEGRTNTVEVGAEVTVDTGPTPGARVGVGVETPDDSDFGVSVGGELVGDTVEVTAGFEGRDGAGDVVDAVRVGVGAGFDGSQVTAEVFGDATADGTTSRVDAGLFGSGREVGVTGSVVDGGAAVARGEAAIDFNTGATRAEGTTSAPGGAADTAEGSTSSESTDGAAADGSDSKDDQASDGILTQALHGIAAAVSDIVDSVTDTIDDVFD